MLSVIRERFPQGFLNSLPLFDLVLLTVSVLSAAMIAALVWANGIGGILFPLLIWLVAGLICLISALAAGGTKNIVSAYAQGQLDTGRFLKRVNSRARFSLFFRTAVICLASTTLACVIAAAFPGRIFAATSIAALLAVVSLRFCGGTGYCKGSGWFFDALVPDEVVLEMTAPADAMVRFRTGWTLSGRVAVLRRAAALHSDLPAEVRQIVLAQYSPQAIFVPVRLLRKSVRSELRLMLAGWCVGSAAIALAAILALAAVTLLPRDLLRIPTLNDLELPRLQQLPEDAEQRTDKPTDNQDQSGNDSASGPPGPGANETGSQGSDGAGGGDASDRQGGDDTTSGAGRQGQDGPSPAGGDQKGQDGTQAGKDAAQQGGDGASDAAGGAGGEMPGANADGRDQAPGADQAADEGGSGVESLNGGGEGQGGQAPDEVDQQGQPGEGGADNGASQQAGQGASDTAGANDNKPGGGKGAPGESAMDESGGSETESSGDLAMTDAAPADSDPGTTDIAGASSSADTPAAVEPGRDADQGQTGPSSDGVPADDPTDDTGGGMREHVDELPEGARVIATRQSPEEPGQDLPVAPPLAGDPAGTPTETIELREGGQPPQADVSLELKAGGPAALFAEEGEVPDAVEARLLPDELGLPPAQAVTSGEPRQILPAWIDELIK